MAGVFLGGVRDAIVGEVACEVGYDNYEEGS